MFPEIKFFPVNWIDGMKVSGQHFLNTEKAVDDWMRDIRAMGIHDHNYGVLPIDSYYTSHDYPTFEVDPLQDPVKIYLTDCRAITVSGIRIEITKDLTRLLQIEDFERPCAVIDSTRDGDYSIFVSVDMKKRQQVGDYVLQGPPRRAYTMPTYKLQIESIKESLEVFPNQVKIGEISIHNRQLRIRRDYIPPCTSIKSNHNLEKYYKDFVPILKKIKKSNIKTISNARKKSANNAIAADAKYLSERVLQYLVQTTSNIEWLIPTQAPIHLVAYFMNLAAVMDTGLQTIGYKKELLNKVPGEGGQKIEQTTKNLLDTIPNHNDIHPTFKQIDVFLKRMEYFWKELSTRMFDDGVLGGKVKSN